MSPNKITKDKKVQCDVNRKSAKVSALSSAKILFENKF